MATPDEMYDEAVALKDQGNLDGAVARFNEILAIDDKHVLAHSALAVSLQKLGRAEDAIRHATRVAELEPDDPFSFTQLSVILQRCGRIPEAETALYKSAGDERAPAQALMREGGMTTHECRGREPVAACPEPAAAVLRASRPLRPLRPCCAVV